MTEIEKKKVKYTCPCGFSSYDLMEFLKHPFLEYPRTQGVEVSEETLKEESQGTAPLEADKGNSTHRDE
jgi:hypothetical protein